VGTPEGKRPLGKLRWRWVDNVKMDLGERGWGGVNCIGLAQNRDKWRALVNVVMKILNSIQCWETTEWLHNWWLSSSAKLNRVSYIFEPGCP
jgi:hypothetical protein